MQLGSIRNGVFVGNVVQNTAIVVLNCSVGGNAAFHTTIPDLDRFSEGNVVFGAGFCVTQRFKSVPLAGTQTAGTPDIEVPGPAAVWYEFSVCI